MAAAKSGDTVQVHYTGKLDDGTVFDSSRQHRPLEVTVGAGEVIGGFEQALVGMGEGDTKTVTIQAEDAYGPRRDELVHEVDKARMPPGVAPEVGQRLQAKNRMGETMALTVADVGEATVVLDANHPLAGEDLTFELEVVKVA